MLFDSADELKAALAPIAAKLSEIDEKRQQVELKLASNFSIFDPIKYDENVISRIIAHLLDPKGSHSQGSSFLKAYLQMLCKENYEKYNTNKIKEILKNQSLVDEAYVRCEDSTKDGGRIDITVFFDASKKFGIENKLTAGDQKDQVLKYLESLPDGGFLVYLSIEDPEKKLGKEWSITKKEAEFERGRGRLFLTKYDPHMSRWIDKCLIIAKSDKIRWYLAEIKQLVTTNFSDGGNSQMESNNEVMEIFLKDERSFKAALMAASYIGRMKEQLAQNYLEHIQDELKKGMQQYKNWKIDTDYDKSKPGRDGRWYPIKIKNKDHELPYIVSLMFEDQTTTTKRYNKCFYGIVENPDFEQNSKGPSEYFDKIKDKTEGVYSSMGWSGGLPRWECFNNNKDQDWMATGFLLKLQKFYIEKKSSTLLEEAKIVVERMLKLLEIVASFFKEKGIIK